MSGCGDCTPRWTGSALVSSGRRQQGGGFLEYLGCSVTIAGGSTPGKTVGLTLDMRFCYSKLGSLILYHIFSSGGLEGKVVFGCKVREHRAVS